MKDHPKKIDVKLVKQILIAENKFLNDLFSIVPVPSHAEEQEGM